MQLGQFSLSLAVKDIEAAYSFYQKLGFKAYDDQRPDKWMILRQGDTYLGLFEGMFPNNLMTFHTANASAVYHALADMGLELPPLTDEQGAPVTYLMLTDPDGNEILIDQVDPDYRPEPGV